MELDVEGEPRRHQFARLAYPALTLVILFDEMPLNRSDRFHQRCRLRGRLIAPTEDSSEDPIWTRLRAASADLSKTLILLAAASLSCVSSGVRRLKGVQEHVESFPVALKSGWRVLATRKGVVVHVDVGEEMATASAMREAAAAISYPGAAASGCPAGLKVRFARGTTLAEALECDSNTLQV